MSLQHVVCFGMADLQELFAVRNCVRQDTLRMLKPAMIFVGQSIRVSNYFRIIPSHQGRIKLFGAPRLWKHFRPLFQAVFLSGGVLPPTPPDWVKHQPPSPKTEITNILFYILNLWLRIYCSGLRGCDTREKEIVIWQCWCFMTDIIFTLLSLLLCL